jgi:putative ABC transport system permease protein
MNPVSRKLVLRALSRERGRALLALFSVALGVAVFLSIRLANRAAVSSFEGFARGVGQGSDLVARAEVGPLKESRLAELASLRERAWMRPILEGSFNREGSLEAFQLIGLDLVGISGTNADDPEPSAMSSEAQSFLAQSFYDSIQKPDGVLISMALAKAERLKPGDALRGFINERPVQLRVAGILFDAKNRPALQRNLLIMDLPAAQVILGREGELDRLELGARGACTPSDLESAARKLALPGLTLEPPEQRASSGKTMSAAFRFNLTILSLIALAVGAYLLFQTFDAAVNRRRETWATLRALGCPPQRVMRLVLLEATLIGTFGSALGVLLGWAMAQGAVRGVSRTVDALYGASAAHSANLLWDESLVAFGMGCLACLIAAWLPARRAARTPSVQLLARGSETRPTPWLRFTLSGLAMLASGALVAYLPDFPAGVAWHVYVGALLILLGGSFASVGLLPMLGSFGRSARSWSRRLAFRPLIRPTGRHGFAAAALAVAVGMATGMGVMVQSFERTVESWIGTNLHADLYAAPLGSTGAASKHRLSPETADALAADASVEAADRFEMVPIQVNGQPTFLGAGDFGVQVERRTLVMAQGGRAQDLMRRLRNDGVRDPGAFASETFSRRFGIRLNQRIEIPTPDGTKTITVRGIFADYGNERGSLIIDRPIYLAWFRDPKIASLALYLKPGEDAEKTAQRLTLTHPGLQVRSNRALREQVSTIFHQTFALTYALEIIGVAVALIGLVQALLGLAMSRRGELWTLRALGAREGEITRVLMGEGLGVALAGLLGGLGMGLLLARLLVDVLNPQVFGWTLRFSLPFGFLALMTFSTLSAAAAALWPAAKWGARLQADREAEEGA